MHHNILPQIKFAGSMLFSSFYHICSKYWDRQAWANSVDPDQTPQNAASDQGLHCLPHVQKLLDTSIGSEMELFIF